LRLNAIDWIDFGVLETFFLSLLLFMLLDRSWPFFLGVLKIKKYKSIQRVHFYDAPRLGGAIVFLSSIVFVFLCKDSAIKSILGRALLFFLPAFIFALKEDIFYNVRPFWRFVGLMISAILFMQWFYKALPIFNIPFFDFFIFPPLDFFIYTLAIVAVANGSNLVDGVNGLCSFIFFTIFLCILFLSYKSQDLTLMVFSAFFIVQILAFIIFNYPKGFIFLGDAGAYFLGFCSSILSLFLFSRNPDLNYLLIFLILVYPLTEVVFTFLRRAIAGLEIYKPDRKHLHLLIYELFRPISHLKKYANNAVAPALSFLWLYPLVLLPFVYKNNLYIIFSLVFFILLYFLIYKSLSAFQSK
jgi:UDP-N-acetylmuramyl pentapeptide phosphotransferase/UDP-N-acetylglucosamine-1-phosphate transferase